MTTNSSDHDHLAIIDLYKLAIAARDFEINQLVQRNNFFMIFQGVLLAGLIQAAGNGKIVPIVSFLVCTAGLLASLLQIGMAAGAKFWQERWEYAVETAEKYLHEKIKDDDSRKEIYEVFVPEDGYSNKVVADRMKGKLIGPLVCFRFSPSRIPIYAGLVFLLVWLLLLGAQISGPFSIPSWLVGFKQC